jgi:hypothetical protein
MPTVVWGAPAGISAVASAWHSWSLGMSLGSVPRVAPPPGLLRRSSTVRLPSPASVFP